MQIYVATCEFRKFRNLIDARTVFFLLRAEVFTETKRFNVIWKKINWKSQIILEPFKISLQPFVENKNHPCALNLSFRNYKQKRFE